MTGKDTIDVIMTSVKEAQSQGAEQIDSNALLHFLNDLKNEEGISHEFQIENLKANHQQNLEITKSKVLAQIEVFKSVITVGANAVRHMLLINGGAAIALLAFLGTIWEKKSTEAAIGGIAIALLIFCGGVLASGLCAGFTYISQYCYGSDPIDEDNAWKLAAKITNVLAVALGFASLICFAIGAYAAFQSVGAQFPLNK